jgi:hypothetical protein
LAKLDDAGIGGLSVLVGASSEAVVQTLGLEIKSAVMLTGQGAIL